MSLSTQETAAIIAEYATKEGDSGSSQVQAQRNRQTGSVRRAHSSQ